MKEAKGLKKYKNTAVIVFFVVSGMYLYHVYGPKLTLLESSDQEVGSDLVKLLGQLESADLDQGLFQTTVYKSLSDFSTEIAPQPTGRRNPFDILGRD